MFQKYPIQTTDDRDDGGRFVRPSAGVPKA
jgi:hypothetical protein